MKLSNDEYARQVMEIARNAFPVSFQPTAYYDHDGDCIEFIMNPDDYYAERVDDLLTVYYSRDTHEITGSLIKGVKKFYKEILNKYPGFQVVVNDGKIRLSHLFLAGMWSQVPSNTKIKVYKVLADQAEVSRTETELCLT